MRKLQERWSKGLWMLALMATIGLGWGAAQDNGQYNNQYDNGQNTGQYNGQYANDPNSGQYNNPNNGQYNGQYNDGPNNGPYNQDPPAEAVRISYSAGAVSVQQAGSEDWAQAGVNFPLAPGDRLYVDQDSIAELEIGRTYVRVNSGTDLSIVEISPGSITLGLAQGSVHVHTFGLWPGQQLVISTTNGGINLSQPAEFRVDVYPDQQSTVFTNFSGATHVFAAGDFSDYVYPNSSLQLSGVNPVYPQWLAPNPPDRLDEWSMNRDMSLEQSISAQYVSPEMPGYNDLDNNGNWDPNTPYGPAWFPNNVAYGWMPYHYGHWIVRPYWGWVWVEDEPWGYAPFHYGRWVNFGGRWGWIPGPPAMRPVWSPALVVFGGGIQIGGVGISIWFPLGPGEAYRPWYQCSNNYINQVNITNIRETKIVHVQNNYVTIVNNNVNNITYVNQRVGASAMRHADFAAGRPVAQSAVHVDQRQIQHMQILAKPVPPTISRPLIIKQPLRPVPVASTRPLLINQQGRQIQAIPNARPVTPPMQRTPPEVLNRPLPNRRPVAPPPNHAQPFTPQQPNREPQNNGRQFAPQQPNNYPQNNPRPKNEPYGGRQMQENEQPKVMTPQPVPQRPVGNEYVQPERPPVQPQPQRPEIQYQEPRPQEVRPPVETPRPQPEFRPPPPPPRPQPEVRSPPPDTKPVPKPPVKPAPKPATQPEPNK